MNEQVSLRVGDGGQALLTQHAMESRLGERYTLTPCAFLAKGSHLPLTGVYGFVFTNHSGKFPIRQDGLLT